VKIRDQVQEGVEKVAEEELPETRCPMDFLNKRSIRIFEASTVIILIYEAINNPTQKFTKAHTQTQL